MNAALNVMLLAYYVLTYRTISSNAAYNLHISAGNLGIGLTVTGVLKIFGSNVEYFVH